MYHSRNYMQKLMKFTLQIKLNILRKTSPILVMLFALSLCSCGASYKNRYFPVKNLAQRESSLGFSITPPTGNSWFEKLNNDSLYYLKKTGRKDYAIYTKATEIHLNPNELKADNFLKFVTKTKKLQTASGNLKNVAFQIIPDNALSPLCVRYILTYEDHSVITENKDEYINVKNRGLVCMHPDTLFNGVDMCYVESSLHSSKKSIGKTNEEGEYFLRSLKFHSQGT